MNRRHPIISRAWLSASKRTAEAKVQINGASRINARISTRLTQTVIDATPMYGRSLRIIDDQVIGWAIGFRSRCYIDQNMMPTAIERIITIIWTGGTGRL